MWEVAIYSLINHAIFPACLVQGGIQSSYPLDFKNRTSIEILIEPEYLRLHLQILIIHKTILDITQKPCEGLQVECK